MFPKSRSLALQDYIRRKGVNLTSEKIQGGAMYSNLLFTTRCFHELLIGVIFALFLGNSGILDIGSEERLCQELTSFLLYLVLASK